MSQLGYRPVSCQNCGHPQHCGGAYYMQVRDYGPIPDEPRTIKACDSCRCVDCSNETNQLEKHNEKLD